MNIYQRINAIMRDVPGVRKERNNPQGRYAYAGHEDVTAALHAGYVKHGVVRTATVLKCDILDGGTVMLNVRVSWVSKDDPADRLEVDMPAIQSSVRKEGNLSPVQVGMALSYAVKNAEFKCFALTGDDTPDTEEEDHREPAADTSEFANGAGQEHLRRFEAAQTMDEWKAVNEDIKSKWDTLKHIKGFSEDLVRIRTAAAERIRGQRQPGQEG
jgi:hypothetical protein